MPELKAQMVFEFIVAAMLFFAIVLYVITYMNTAVLTYSMDFESNSLQIKAIHISDLILHNEGIWSNGVPTILGLASGSGWPILDPIKVSELQLYCGVPSNYDTLVYEILGLDINDQVNIKITQSPAVSWSCESPFESQDQTVANVRRYGILNGNPVSIDIWVW